MFEPPGECPVCRCDVFEGAKACPDCGADERSGWQEIEFPAEAFDYQTYMAEEFGQDRGLRDMHPVWMLAAVILVFAMFGFGFFSLLHSAFFQ
ncbi:MAG: hypothetical protein WCP06_08425 [Verrucomicrobiota bacterium]